MTTTERAQDSDMQKKVKKDKDLPATLGALSEFRKELKSDIASLRIEIKGQGTELRGEMDSSSSELRGEMGSLSSELRGEMQSLSTELRGEMRSLSTELRGEMAKLDTGLRGEMSKLDSGLRGEMSKLEVQMSKMASAQHRMLALLEEQNTRNKASYEGAESVRVQQEKLTERVEALEVFQQDVTKKLKSH